MFSRLKSHTLKLIKYVADKGFFHLLSANILIQVVSFASQLFVAGILSPSDIGRIKIIQSFMSLFTIVAGMGFNTSTLKLASENKSAAEIQQIFRSGLIFTIASSVCMYVIILILNYFKLFSSDQLINWLIPLGLFPLITNAVFGLFVSYFQAVKQIKLISTLTMSNKIVSILAIVLLTIWFGIKGYYFALNASLIIIVLVSFRLSRSQLDIPINDIRGAWTMHWKYAKHAFTANFLSALSAYIDILLINIFTNNMHETGIYSFALTLTVILTIFPSTVQQITMPYFSGLANDRFEFAKIFRKYNKILYGVVSITLILSLIFAAPIIGFVFQGKYDASMPYFQILAIGWSIRQLTQLQSGAIFGLGKIQYTVYISIISLVLNIVIYSLFIHFLQIKGAAFASIPANILLLLISYLYFKKAMR